MPKFLNLKNQTTIEVSEAHAQQNIRRNPDFKEIHDEVERKTESPENLDRRVQGESSTSKEIKGSELRARRGRPPKASH